MNAIIETDGELHIEAENTKGYALLSWVKKLPRYLDVRVIVTGNTVFIAIPEFKKTNVEPFTLNEITLIRRAILVLDVVNTDDLKYRQNILSKLKELTK